MPKFIFHYGFEILSVIILAGLLYFSVWTESKFTFSIVVILTYWFLLRKTEISILDKNQEIYDVYSKYVAKGGTQEDIDNQTEQEQRPLRHELEQLESKRKFFVDKFVLVSLILTVLLQF